jgi:hypothetical protein
MQLLAGAGDAAGAQHRPEVVQVLVVHRHASVNSMDFAI